jgi:glucosamine-6-phosphate deaminase
MHLGGQAPFGSLSYFGLGYVEKPDAATAANLIEGGRHDWNSGMFAWTADTFWQAVREFSPCSADVFDKLRKSTCPDLVGSTFASLPRLAVDKGILEHVGANTALRHLFVRADVEWDDIGHYAALESHLSADSSNNRIAGPLTVSDSTGNTLICEGQTNLHVRGVKDLIVVSDSGDLLVASRASYARVRDLAMTDLWSGGSSPGSSNAYSGFVKSVGSEGCVVQSDGNGIVALLDVKDIEVRVYDGGIVVSSRRPTDEAAPISDTAGRGLSASTRLTISEDELRMSQLAAEHVVASIGSLLASGRQPLVMFSAGRTPQGLFKLLRSRYRTALDWSRVRVAQMDEFVGVRDSQSYATFLREELTEPLGVGQFLAIDRSWDHGGLAAFERSLLEDGLDLVVHGIGCNGHLGFNEPGSPFNGKSKIAALAAITRQRAVASFGTLGNVPEAGYTLGLQVLNSASEVVLMAASEDKSIALRNALFGSIDDRVPASSLQTHPRVSVYADRFAASSWLREPRA